jgi:hypothetical protein
MNFRTGILFLLLSLANIVFAQTQRVSGTVVDSKSGESIPRARIAVIGTKQGAIANADGNFVIEVGTSQRLRITAKGYVPDTVAADEKQLTVRLKPVEIRGAEVVVTGNSSREEARRIIREAIRRKKLWRDALIDYSCRSYARWSVRTTSSADSVIQSVVESQADGFWNKRDGYYERIIARKQTANFPAQANIFTFASLLNFYDDRVDFGDYSLVSPVADDALSSYDFDLIRTTVINGEPSYEIRLYPGVVSTAFDGTIWISEENYSLVYADLTLSRAVRIPFLRDVRFQQTYDLYRDSFWMPVDLRGSLGAGVAIPGTPSFQFDLLSIVKDYRMNTGLHDSLFQGARNRALPQADSVDSLQWNAERPIPLTVKEEKAYTRIDSVMKEKAEPSGGFNLLSLLSFIELPQHDQIEGWRLGLGKTFAPFESFPMQMSGYVNYGFRDEKLKYTIGLRQGILWTTRKGSVFSAGLGGEFSGKYQDINDVSLWLNADYHDDITARGDAYPTIFNSIFSLAYSEDYAQFYYDKGFRIGLEWKPLTPSGSPAFALDYRRSRIQPASKLIAAVDTTLMNVTNASLTLEAQHRFAVGDAQVAVAASFESASDMLGSSVSYSSSRTTLEFSTRLGGWGKVEVNGLYHRITSGNVTGWNVPFFEGRDQFLSKRGGFKTMKPFEFMGDEAASVYLEHNFYDLPTRLIGLDLSSLDLHWRIYGGAAVMNDLRHGTLSVTGKTPFVEAGFGIGNIMNIIGLNASWRLTHKAETNFYPSLVLQFSF